jgi:hypothetical protein
MYQTGKMTASFNDGPNESTESKELREQVRSGEAKVHHYFVLTLPSPIHVSTDSQKLPCHFCKRQLWGPNLKSAGIATVTSTVAAATAQQSVCCPPCFKRELKVSDVMVQSLVTQEVFLSCVHVLSGYPSLSPVPSWRGIVSHKDVHEHPRQDSDGCMLVHACASFGRVDALKAVLERWPESVNTTDAVYTHTHDGVLCAYARAIPLLVLHAVFSSNKIYRNVHRMC